MAISFLPLALSHFPQGPSAPVFLGLTRSSLPGLCCFFPRFDLSDSFRLVVAEE